jgi:hypothetical protein
MRNRHITLSKQQGMITELELIGAGFRAGERYLLRYHKPGSDSTNGFDFGLPDLSSVSWSGFRYRNNEISILMERQTEPQRQKDTKKAGIK